KCGSLVNFNSTKCQRCGLEVEHIVFENKYGDIYDSLFLFEDIHNAIKDKKVVEYFLDPSQHIIRILLKKGDKYSMLIVNVDKLIWDL
ncbi:MAG: hypothetical protein DRN20_00245, partial [Thermoplasmata archaeon]